MTDERIKESYDTWILDSSTTAHEIAFLDQAINDIEADIMLGFYAGFRAAERLAKIEALEPVLLMMDKLRFFSVADYKDAKDRIDTMIAELKEEGE